MRCPTPAFESFREKRTINSPASGRDCGDDRDDRRPAVATISAAVLRRTGRATIAYDPTSDHARPIDDRACRHELKKKKKTSVNNNDRGRNVKTNKRKRRHDRYTNGGGQNALVDTRRSARARQISLVTGLDARTSDSDDHGRLAWHGMAWWSREIGLRRPLPPPPLPLLPLPLLL